jgi:hypothetical protein
MSFIEASTYIRNLQLPIGLSKDWESPYRLLAGAAYSIGLAEGIADSGDPLPSVDADWWATLEASANNKIIDKLCPEWMANWFASFTLTNAIFRVAAATEKLCYLVGDLGQRDRKFLWKAVRQKKSHLSVRVPAAHQALGQMPDSRKKRADKLKRIRGAFAKYNQLTLPLLCAFIQTDIDKHVPYQPIKRLAFDRLLATESLKQASKIWNEAMAWKLVNP